MGVSTEEAIAIIEDNGSYRKAVREGKYAYGDPTYFIYWIVGGITLVVLLAFAFNELESKARKKSLRER